MVLKVSPAVVLVSVILLWVVDLPVIGIPVYFLVGSLFIFACYRALPYLVSVFMVILLYILLLAQQVFSIVEVINPLRTYSFAVFFVLAYAFVSVAITRITFNYQLLSQFFVWYLTATLIAQTAQYVVWPLGLIKVEYLHYIPVLPRFSGFYAEPSHLAIGIAPAMYFVLFASQLSESERKSLSLKRIKNTLIPIAMLSPSSTLLLILLVLSACFVFKNISFNTKRIAIVALAMVFLPILLNLLLMNKDFKERIDDVVATFEYGGTVEATMNPSSLLFRKGLDMAAHGFKEYPLGVGPLNMEVLADVSPVSVLSDFYARQNNNDGTSLFFKTVVEFGWLGGVFCIFVVFYFVTFLRRQSTAADIFIGSLVFSFVCSFLRGTSYFDGAPLLGLVAVLMLLFGFGVRREVG